ncbi:MAG TPA: DUF6706 family protein [Bacteroidales bacterium]|nr:DUF6706 family protein [Bacteroidales bacterium]
MTNLEALQAVLPGIGEVTDNLYTKVLLDRDVASSDVYDDSVKDTIDLCSADLMVILLRLPDIQEGGLAIRYDRGYMRSQAQEIYSRLGTDSEKATIDGTSKW